HRAQLAAALSHQAGIGDSLQTIVGDRARARLDLHHALEQVIAANGATPPERIGHPIEVLAKAYGL
ncbi:MAG TPA: hypothetical protein PK479_05945, partial [Novosphingobium sp.]|nr:hypothetical protein [Novosphingobium sp.]